MRGESHVGCGRVMRETADRETGTAPRPTSRVLEATRAREQRLRVLPSRVGIYFVLALGLFPGLGYGIVRQKLIALDGLGLPCPSAEALRDLSRRIGIAPVKALFEVLAGPVAQPLI